MTIEALKFSNSQTGVSKIQEVSWSNPTGEKFFTAGNIDNIVNFIFFEKNPI